MAEISLIGFALALFIFSLLVSRKNKGLNDIILIIFVLLLGMKLFGLAVEYKGWRSLFGFASVGDVFYWCLLGPLLLLFVKTTLNGQEKLKLTDLVHLLPLILVSSAFSGYLFNYLNKMSLGGYLTDHNGFFPWAGYYLFITVSPAYFIAALILLVRHRLKLRTYYSYTKKVNLGWLFYVTIGFGTYLVVGLAGMLLSQLFGIQLPFSVYRYTSVILVAYLFGLGYIGILRLPGFAEYHRFNKSLDSEPVNEPAIPVAERYRKSGLSEKEAAELLQSLDQFMKINKPYLDESLNLKSLAESLGTSTHKLSQVLNEQLGKTFFEYINDLRIEEVKERLNKPINQQYTLLAIAFDSGFCSKSTFYTSFRKKMGITPGDYLKQTELRN
jgi:AraC-like DNA-binding protein